MLVKNTPGYGFDPDQNPIEKWNEEIKGTSTFVGLIRPGRDIGSTIIQEYPKMVWNFGIKRIRVERNILDMHVIYIVNTEIFLGTTVA